jgi:hypothetical protein
MSSGASAAEEAVASPNPATQQTYPFYLSGQRFGSVVVNTATHKCTFAELPGIEEDVETNGVCAPGSGESTISARLHIVFIGPLLFGEETILFTVHRRSGLVAYSGLGVEFVHTEEGRRTAPIWVELKR